MEEIRENEEKSEYTKNSKPSLDSIQELTVKHRKLFYFSLIGINILSFITGIYILNEHSYYLNPDFKFSNHISLYVFIIIYTLGIISALVFSFVFAIIVKLIYIYKNRKNNNTINENPKSAILSSIQDHSQISFTLLYSNQNEISLIPFTLSYFIIFIIAMYFISLPYAFILIVKLFQNDYLSQFFDFFLIYFFLFINLIAGLIMVIVLFYMVFKKRTGNARKFGYTIDNNNVENIRKEIRDAIKD